MKNKTRRLHDGIVGTFLVIGTALGYGVNEMWFLLPGIIGALMITSAFTGFCGVYYLLGSYGIKN